MFSLEICFALFWKVRTDWRITCVKTMITIGRDCELAEWINKKVLERLWVLKIVQSCLFSWLEKVCHPLNGTTLFRTQWLSMAFESDHKNTIDPPGPGRIGGNYFSHMVSVRPSVTQKTRYNANVDGSENKTKDPMYENNDHLLAGAWWVTLRAAIKTQFPHYFSL